MARYAIVPLQGGGPVSNVVELDPAALASGAWSPPAGQQAIPDNAGADMTWTWDGAALIAPAPVIIAPVSEQNPLAQFFVAVGKALNIQPPASITLAATGSGGPTGATGTTGATGVAVGATGA